MRVLLLPFCLALVTPASLQRVADLAFATIAHLAPQEP